MTVIVACRRRGSPVWSHHFHVEARSWRNFYRHVRLWRDRLEHAIVRNGEYVPVLQ
jgi:hypothetical protein